MRTRPLGTDWLPSRSVLSPGFGVWFTDRLQHPPPGRPRRPSALSFPSHLWRPVGGASGLLGGSPPYQQGHDGDSPNLRLRGCVLVGEDEWPATRCSSELSLSGGQTFSRAAVVSRPTWDHLRVLSAFPFVSHMGCYQQLSGDGIWRSRFPASQAGSLAFNVLSHVHSAGAVCRLLLLGMSASCAPLAPPPRSRPRPRAAPTEALYSDSARWPAGWQRQTRNH